MYVLIFLPNDPNSKFYSIVQKNFVQTIRAVEETLGVTSRPDFTFTPAGNMSATFQKAAECNYSDEVKSVLRDSIPVLLQMILKYGSPDMLFGLFRPGNKALTTKYLYLSPTRLRLGPRTNSLLVALWT